MSVRTLFLLLVCLLGWADSAHAQLPAPDALPNLDLRAGTPGQRVTATADGGAIISHDGRWVAGTLELPRLFRIRPDGTVDSAWQVVPNGTVLDIAVVDDDVYLAGSFSTVNGQARRGLARVALSTGALADWNPNDGSNSSYVFRSLLVRDSSIYIGGTYTQIGAASRTHLAKLDRLTGVLDTNFNPNVSTTHSRAPEIVSMASDGDSLFVAGIYTAINGVNRSNAAKIAMSSGQLDATWAPVFSGGFAEGLIAQIAIDGGQLYAIGCFGQVSGVARNFLARVATTGSGALDTTWNPVPNFGCNVGISVGSSHVYISGIFTQVGGLPARAFARVAKTGGGALDTTWQPVVEGVTRNPGFEDIPFGERIQLLSSGSVILAGTFLTVQGSYQPGIARVSANNGNLLPPAIYSEARDAVTKVLPAPDGGTYVAGNFHRAGNVLRRGLLRITSTGALDINWDPAAALNGGLIWALESDGTHLYVGGRQFRKEGTATPNRLLRMSHGGVIDNSWTPNPNGIVLSMSIDESANSLLVGGGFSSIGGQTRNRIAEISRASGTATTFNPNVTGDFVRSIALAGTDAYIGGNFTAVGGLPRANLAKLSRTGAVNASFIADANGEIRALLPGPNNTLYVGGAFSTISGLGRPGFARLLQSNGAPDPAWTTFVDRAPVLALSPTNDGLYVGGFFSAIGGQARSNVARVSHSGVVAPLFAPRFSPEALSVVEQGSRVLVGGWHNFFAPTNETQIGVVAYPRDATPVATTLNITSDQPENTQPHQFYRVEVNAVADGLPLANQRIQVECDSGAFCEAFLDNAGNGACELASRTPGTRTLTARWAGSPLFLAATDTEPHTVAGTSATPPANPAFDLRGSAFVGGLTRFSDGSLLIGGNFNRIGETPHRGVARLLADGTADPAYSADVIGSVGAVARDATNHAYVVGSFSSIDGVFRRNVAKLSPSGDVVPTWTAATSEVNTSTAHVDSNGDLILQGSLFGVSGSPNFFRTSLLKLSGSSGALLGDFNVEVTTINQNFVPTVRVTGDGAHFYVYGRFDTVNGVPRRNLARLNLNGSVDTSWNPSPNALVRHLIPDGAGGIYLAGDFVEVAGQSARVRLVRLNADGALISGFNTTPNGPVWWLVRDGTALYVSGDFGEIGGLSIGRVAKLDAGTGSADPVFISIPALVQSGSTVVPSRMERLGSALWMPIDAIFASHEAVQSVGAIRVDALTATALPVSNVTRQAQVLALARQPDGATLIGGRFARVGGSQRNLVRISPEGQFDNSFAPALNSFGSVQALLVRGNGDIYAGGLPLLKLSSAGVIDNAFFSTNGTVLALADADDGLVAGGFFTAVGSPAVARNRIAKLDYATGAAIANWNPDANSAVYSLAVNAAGEVYFGGDFTTVGGVARQRLAKLNADGSLNAAWQPAANSRVNTLLADGADVYAGGFFSTLAGQTRRGLGKLSAADGALAPWNPSGNTFPIIYALARAQDGGILVGGSFRFMGGAYRSNVAKLDPVSSVADPLWNPSTDSTVRALLVGYGNTPTAVRLPAVEENIAIGGEFEFMGATPMSGFVAVPTIPVPTEERVFCSGFEANACAPLP